MASQGARPQRISRPKAEPALPSYLALAVFAAGYLVVWIRWPFPVWVHAVYLAASVVAFVAYAVDKRAAGTARRRVPENTLHLLAVAGGWPGAIVAQQSLRHKTAKRSFRRAFWATVAVNVLLFVALATPSVGVLLGL